MDKKEKRPGYFARLKKRRQLKQNQSESCVNEEDQSDAVRRVSIISDQQEKGLKEEKEKIKEQNGDTNTDEGSQPTSQGKKERQRPPGTVEYTVGPSDSLNSIALNFNITPNELVRLNRLFSRSVVPGQRLCVPDVGQSDSGTEVTGSSDAESSAVPGKTAQDGELSGRSDLALRREMSPPSEDESPATVKFIKMSCKYFTDGMGVVGGVMIVTPNNIMFDPHKSDPLVIEHGCEEYGLICPMDEVISVALYDDISRMKIKDALPSDIPGDLCPLYRPGEWEELPSERDLNPFSRYEELERQRRHAHRHAPPPPLDNSPSDEGFTELEPLGGDAEGEQKEKRQEEKEEEEEECDEGLHTRSSEEMSDASRPPSAPANVAPHRAPGEEAVEAVAPGDEVNKTRRRSEVVLVGGAQESADEAGEQQKRDQGDCGKRSPSWEKEEELTAEERRRRNHEAEVKSWLLQRMQGPIENMLLSTEEKSKAPPMFLCFKVGKPMRKSFAAGMTTSPAHSASSRGKLSEYWFAVPQERVEDLYSFLVQWSPEAYGKEAREQGFIVVEKDELNMIDNFFSEVPRNWEIITINEAKRRQSFGSFEEEEPIDLLPCLSDPSAILDDTHIQKLAGRLPARVQGYPWRLAYSTVVHGTSLKTLYRSLAQLDCPVLLLVKDTENQVFGAFSTHPFRVSEHCYGTGETFLFSFCPEIKVYRWTGENSYFVKGNIDSLQLGGGGGRLGLWLDADLYHGTTSSCSTFNNQPLSSQQDFTIHSVEVWAFE